MTKISILIPIYNGIEFLNESVNSVKSQTYENWELIIGINGHPENSEVYNIAKKMIDDKIKVFDLHTIKGKSNALNKMIKYTNSEWIALLDVDDIWFPKKLEYQIPYMEKYDVIGTKCRYFGDSEISPYIPTGNISTFNFLNGNPIINSSCLIKKKYAIWNNDKDGVEDYDLWLKLWKESKLFYNIDNILVLHRIHSDSSYNSKGNNINAKILIEKYK